MSGAYPSRNVVPVTIAKGASLSGAAGPGPGEVVGIILPTKWTTAGVSLAVDAGDGVYVPLKAQDGTEVAIAGPTAGTDERQTVSGGGPTSGTFKLNFGGQATSALNWNATAAQVDAALEALSSIGAGNVVSGGGPLNTTPITVDFVADLGQTNVALMTVTEDTTNGTGVTVAETTPGAAGPGAYETVTGVKAPGTVKVRSGTSGTPVNQASARIVKLVVVS